MSGLEWVEPFYARQHEWLPDYAATGAWMAPAPLVRAMTYVAVLAPAERGVRRILASNPSQMIVLVT